VHELDELLLVGGRRPRFRRDGTGLSVLVDVRQPIHCEEYEGADGLPIAPGAGIDAGDGVMGVHPASHLTSFSVSWRIEIQDEGSENQ
jgi:hypothetical protein